MKLAIRIGLLTLVLVLLGASPLRRVWQAKVQPAVARLDRNLERRFPSWGTVETLWRMSAVPPRTCTTSSC